MSIEKTKNHITELRNRHYALDLQLNEMIHTKQPDDKIAKVKKEKLKIKDEITALETSLRG